MAKYFDIWDTVGDIEKSFDVTYTYAAAMCRRGEIPKRFDCKLLEILTQKGFRVTLQEVSDWHDAHAERRKLVREKGLTYKQSLEIPFPNMPWTPKHPEGVAA